MHSANQAAMDSNAFADASALYGGQWVHPGHGHPKDMGQGHQLSPEDMILQAATHMQSANHDFGMDNGMSAPMGHHMQYEQHHHLARHPLPADQYAGNASFTEGDSQMLDRDDNEEGDSLVSVNGTTKAPTRSSANNELEMRQLFGSNKHRSLQDVAGELHGNERGPNSERTRQVFAMLWYVYQYLDA